MFKFIILFILSFAITKLLYATFGHKNAGEETSKKEVIYKITAENGVVGCLSKEKFREAADYYSQGNLEPVKKMMAEEICFIFKKGEEVKALEGTCDNDQSDNLFPFKSERFLLVQPYLPCFAVARI
jgi:hypothetical protein